MMNINWSLFKGTMNNKEFQPFVDLNNMLAEVGGVLTGEYVGVMDKVTFEIDGIEMCQQPNNFKSRLYTNILDFKAQVVENGDIFIKFVDKTKGEKEKLVAKIETYDGGTVEIEMGSYSKFVEGRKSFYEYCKVEGIEVLSPYLGGRERISVDFGCGHGVQTSIPSIIKNQGSRCKQCSNEKAGERMKGNEIWKLSHKAPVEVVEPEIDNEEMLPLGITGDENSALEAMEIALELLDKQRTVLLNQIILLKNKAKY